MKAVELGVDIYHGSAYAAWSALNEAVEHLKFPLHVVAKQFFFFGSQEELHEIVTVIPGERLFCSESGNDRASVFQLSEGGVLEITYTADVGVFPVACTFYAEHEKALTYLLEAGLKETTEQPDKTDVVFAFAPKDKLQLVYRQFDSISFESIAGNYSEQAQAGLRELIARLLDLEQAGLGVLHGPPGTGKTYAIRSILSELGRTRTGIVCVPPSEFLSRAHLMCEAIAQNDHTLVILEDSGEIFHQDSKTRFSDQFSTLANITDGLMSLLGNVTFLLTFNYDVGKLDPALMRRGRCIAEVEVPLLSAKEAREWAGPELLLPSSGEPISLADLYALRVEAGEHQFAAKKGPMGLAALADLKGYDEPILSPGPNPQSSGVTSR